MASESKRPTTHWLRRLELYIWGVVIVLAALPMTVIIPLFITRRFTQRFRDERRLARWHGMIGWAHFTLRWLLRVKLDVRGPSQEELGERGFLYISNHQSFIDIPVLIASLGTVAFLAKREVRRYPVLGTCAYCGGSVFVDRGATEDRQRALADVMRMCQESTAVVVFPEGKRSRDGALLEKVHFASMREAYALGLPVVPVALHGTINIMPSSLDRIRRGQRVAVRIGTAVDPAVFDDSEAYARASWERVGQLHQEAREWVEGDSAAV